MLLQSDSMILVVAFLTTIKYMISLTPAFSKGFRKKAKAFSNQSVWEQHSALADWLFPMHSAETGPCSQLLYPRAPSHLSRVWTPMDPFVTASVDTQLGEFHASPWLVWEASIQLFVSFHEAVNTALPGCSMKPAFGIPLQCCQGCLASPGMTSHVRIPVRLLTWHQRCAI